MAGDSFFSLGRLSDAIAVALVETLVGVLADWRNEVVSSVSSSSLFTCAIICSGFPAVFALVIVTRSTDKRSQVPRNTAGNYRWFFWIILLMKLIWVSCYVEYPT